MSNKAIDLAATPRTEFGKGAARRARRSPRTLVFRDPARAHGPALRPKVTT